jgi:hypothetical protein
MTVRAGRITGGTINGKTIILAGASGVIRSDDFVTGTSGWQIAGDGSAEFNDVLVRGDIESGNWDGTSPANLATVDAGATVGFYLDSSVGSAQFEGDIFLGGDLTLDGSGTVRTAPSGQRVEMIGSAVDRISLYDASDVERATLVQSGGGFSLQGDQSSAVQVTQSGTLSMSAPGGVTVQSNSDDVTIAADANQDTADSAVIVAVDNAEVARFTEEGISTAARGQLGYAEVTANQATITSEVDLTGLTSTVTVGTSRRIQITAVIRFGVTNANNNALLRIKESTTVLQIGDQESTRLSATANHTIMTSRVLTPSAGSHTYKLSLEMNAGTGSISLIAGTTNPAFILVEDIGPA